MLSIVAMSNNVFDDAPRTSYLKAIDIWILTCFTITFVTLAETVVVIYLERNQQEQGRDSITILIKKIITKTPPKMLHTKKSRNRWLIHTVSCHIGLS